MNEIEEEEYELLAQHRLAQNIVTGIGTLGVKDMLTSEELVYIATNSISFENAHLVAHSLVMTELTVARALYEELKYYADNGRI